MDDEIVFIIGIYHCKRCKIDLRERRRMNTKVLMRRLERRMKIDEENSHSQHKK